ncbi:MAG: hypothetical protein J6N76_10055, partial [Lachnospiraceae bacterium]|nr:hypothetical protein [Lachnospiraceae bacterium]
MKRGCGISNNKRRYASAALLIAGAMLFSACFIGTSTYTVSAAEHSTIDVATQSTVDVSGEEDTMEETGSTLIKDSFSGHLTLYRWEKVTGEFPKKDELQPVMLYTSNAYFSGNPRTNFYYSAASLREISFNELMKQGKDAYRMSIKELGEYTGLHTVEDLASIKTQSWLNNLKARYHTSYYAMGGQDINIAGDKDLDNFLRVPDRAYQYQKKDPQIKTDRDVFYTDDNRDCPYIMYVEPKYDNQGNLKTDPGFNLYYRGDSDYIYFLATATDGDGKKTGGQLINRDAKVSAFGRMDLPANNNM